MDAERSARVASAECNGSEHIVRSGEHNGALRNTTQRTEYKVHSNAQAFQAMDTGATEHKEPSELRSTP